MRVALQHKDLTIEVFDDSSFTETSDSPTSYEKVYRAGNGYTSVSQHAIIIYRDSVKTTSAILLADAGATSVTSDAVLIDGDNLITRCCNTVFCLSIPELNLIWMAEADWATCFSIHKYQDSYITHGEISVARIDRKGNLLWSYSGTDIFVCLDRGTPFKMHNSHIELTDFSGGKYEIDYNGETISYKQ
ncbi:hypothetical protein [Paraflavitalea sp. CAU 1676]|uniref:hypothetical protein n=1 Tax=Paraflavitalea sp. CAU 1676 TaxID=3032598 RepID=UPI0023DA69B8|nr:hypothetical protein [Paraflavitalea sp. CAU 1676]MDF2187912.1 hypothetical protein [Paraflavitalea sp. CAU 1676]